MIILDNQTNEVVDLELLNKIVNFLEITRDIELLIVNNSKIKEFNLEYRDINKETDVLSFPLEGFENMPLGSIVISIDKAKEASKQYCHSLDSEICLLFTHGLLHLNGYDHEVDSGEMREKEQIIIEYFKLPKSLIIRTQGE